MDNPSLFFLSFCFQAGLRFDIVILGYGVTDIIRVTPVTKLATQNKIRLFEYVILLYFI
jgi:hypothetical protein